MPRSRPSDAVIVTRVPRPIIRARVPRRGLPARGVNPRAVAAALVRNWRTLLWLTPAILALAYGLVVLAEFRSIIGQIYLNSDSAAAPVLGHLAGEAPAGALVVLGNHPWYEEFLFLRLTSGLPDYRQLWDVAPLLWSLLGLALLGWTTARALGRSAGLLAVSAVVCVGAFGRIVFLTFDWHGLSVVHTVVIAAALVWLTPRAAAFSWWRIGSMAVVLGLIGVLPAASDQLFVFWALIPMVVTGLAVAWRGAGRVRARMAAFAIVAAAISLVGGALVAHAMRAGGVVGYPFAFTLVPAGSVVNNVLLTFESYMYIAGGYFFGSSTSVSAWAVFASGVLTLAALVLVLVEVRRCVASAAPRPPAGDPAVGARFAYIAFWATALMTTTAVYLATSAPVDTNGGRYLLAGYVAIGALLPLLATRGLGWRLAVTAGISVFALSAIYQLLQQSFAVTGPTLGPVQAAALTRYAQQEHVSYGYTGYWDAVELTWETRFRLQVYPVTECVPATHSLCAFPVVKISTWYTSHPRARSLLIVDPAQVAPVVTGVSPAFGRPISSTTIGSLSVYVFPYNIGTKLVG